MLPTVSFWALNEKGGEGVLSYTTDIRYKLSLFPGVQKLGSPWEELVIKRKGRSMAQRAGGLRDGPVQENDNQNTLPVNSLTGGRPRWLHG